MSPPGALKRLASAGGSPTHPAARPRLEPTQLLSVEGLSEFTQSAAPRLVVFTGKWQRSRCEAAVSLVRAASAAEGVEYACAEFCDDEGGELFYEAGVQQVPTVRCYAAGAQVSSLGGVPEAAQIAAAIRAAEQPPPASNNMDVDGPPPAAGAPSPKVDAVTADTPPEVQTQAEFDALIQGGGLTVADFFAVWCKPCMKIMPQLPDMMKTYPDIKFVKVDRDRLKTVHDACGVEKIPTFQIYKGGEKLDSLQSSDHSRVRVMIERHRGGPLALDDDF